MIGVPEYPVGLDRARLPQIFQRERAECGLTCIAMIARYHGRPADLDALRARYCRSSRGLRLDALLDAAARSGLCGRPVRLSRQELGKLRLPAILHWRMDHFVVLARVRRRSVLIHDPAGGRRNVDLNSLNEAFTGIAVEFTPRTDFVPAAAKKKPGMLALVGNVTGLWRYLATALFLMLTSQVFALAPAVATQVLIDEALLGQERAWLYLALAGLAAVMLTAILLDALRSWISLFTGTRLAIDTTVNLVSHLLSLPVRFVENRHLGDILSKLNSLVPLRQAITDDGVIAVSQLVVLLTTTSVMLLYSQSLTLISVGGMLATAGLTLVLAPRVRQLGEEALVHRAAENSSLLETLRGYATVSGLGIADVRRRHWQAQFSKATAATVRQGKLGIVRTAGIGVISALEQILFLGVGIGAVLDQQLTVGVLFAFLGLRARFAGAAMGLVDVTQRFILLKVHAGRLSDLALAAPEKASVRGALADPVAGVLSARRIGFSYEDDRPLLCGVSFDVPAGSHAVITGPSGCGKTTLLKILSGQLQPDTGEILLGGIEMSLRDRRAVRQQFGLVMQNDHLFQGSIADNIASFSPVPDLARVRAAALVAGIWADIQALPMRAETPIGDTGHTLSGGQVQRLILARALYRRPKVLFLDEATSHLDTQTEEAVLRNIERLDMTIVSVAHRPATMRRAGQVITLPGPGIAARDNENVGIRWRPLS